jgi:hypothetical protein
LNVAESFDRQAGVFEKRRGHDRIAANGRENQDSILVSKLFGLNFSH